MKPILIVKTGTTVPPLLERRGDFEQWFGHGLNHPCELLLAQTETPPSSITCYGGVLVTGSSSMVSWAEDWSERTAAWLAQLPATLPVLGVCYGHQLLAHALGGKVGPNPSGRHIGTSQVRLNADSSDALLGGLPGLIEVQVSHVEAVLQAPPGATVLGQAALDPKHLIHFRGNHWGMQCHPEFDADIVRGYLDYRRGEISAEGLKVDELMAAAHDTPWGARLLERFAGLVRRLS